MDSSVKAPRVRILVLALIVLFVAGLVNAASVFVQPLADHYGWPNESIAKVVTYYALMMTPGHILGGFLLHKIGAKMELIVGAILMGLAFIWSSSVPTSMPGMLYIPFSIIQGLGLGCLYTGGTYCATSWWPDRRGLAAGLCMACNGGSAIVLAPLVVKMIYSSLGVVTTMRIIGIGIMVIVIVCAIGCKSAPANFKPAGWEDKKNVDMQKVKDTQLEDVKASKVFATSAYWHIAPAFGLFPILYVIMYPRFSIMLTDAGFSVAAATFGVSLYNMANIIGRVGLGTLADKINYRIVYWMLVAISVVSALVLIGASNAVSLPMFYAAYFLLGVGFGPVNSIHPIAISYLWGPRYAGNIYGFVMLGYMLIGTFISPYIHTALVAHTGGYTASCIYAIICCIAAGALYTTAKRPPRRTLAQVEAEEGAAAIQ